VLTGSLPPEEAWFEILDAADATAVRQELAELEQAAGPNVPRSTLAALRAEALAERNLLSDARRTVLAALKSDPDEPALHLLLGDLYKRMGLKDQAAEAFEEAALLSRGKQRY
jgi:Tfp pilus assembly protein PilF